MPGVTVERLLWIIVTIVVAGVVLFGVIYPYIVGISTVKEFTVTDVSAYYDDSSKQYVVYLTIKNLGTTGITSVEATIDGYTIGLGSVPSGGIGSGEEYALSGGTTTGISGGTGRKILVVTVTFDDGSKITHTYDVLVKKKR